MTGIDTSTGFTVMTVCLNSDVYGISEITTLFNIMEALCKSVNKAIFSRTFWAYTVADRSTDFLRILSICEVA